MRAALDTMIAVAGCVAQAEGRGDHSSARPWSISWSGRKAIIELPALIGARARGRRARGRHRLSRPRTSSSPCPSGRRHAPAFGLSHRAGRLRQVLHLLRRALYARRGIFAARRRHRSPRRERLARGGAREITLLGQNVNAYHGEGPDGRDWSLAQAAQSAWRASTSSSGSATRRAIRATWMTISSRCTAMSRS